MSLRLLMRPDCAMAKKTVSTGSSKARGTSHSGAPYDLTDDFHARFLRLLRTKSAAEISRELGVHLSKKLKEPIVVDPSSLSHLKTRKYPSSKWAGPIAEMYGWPIPPLARNLLDNDPTSRSAAVAAKLERLREINPTSHANLEIILDGELLKSEGQLLIRQGAAALRDGPGEPGMRRVDSDRDLSDDESGPSKK